MKKRRRLTMKNLIKFFMVMAVLCMTACSQTFEDVSNNAKPQEKTQGRLVMNVGNRSRTIMPIIAADDIKSATLTANNTEIRSWNGDNVIGQIESDNSILLDVGTYNFEMKFYNGNNENSDVILSGTIDNQEIKTGDNSLTFDMQISTTGNGNISITLSRGADSGINKIKAELYKIAIGEAVENYGMKELTISSDTYTTCYSKDDVPAGQYIIKFEIYDATNKLLNTLTDVIEVIGGITTTHQITLDKINTQYYTITYNLDGGEWKGFTPITKRNANTNTKIILPTADKINKADANNTNCIFGVWYDGNGNVITEISSGTTEDITVTAVWGTIKGTNTVEWYTTANTVAAVIETLSGEYTHDIVVTGEISDATISDIKGALQSKSNAKVNLDLSKTSGLTSLGYEAFARCSSLTSVKIPDSVTSIGTQVFLDCTGLTSVTIGNSVASIGQSAFARCSSLTSVTIPDSVTSIGYWAFKDCTGLTTVNYKGTQEEWEYNIYIYNGNEALTNAARNYNTITVTASKVSTEISNLTKGGSYTIIVTEEISDATISAIKTVLQKSRAKVNLDLSGTTGSISLGSSAFESCTGLTSVIIGDSVTTIGDRAFYGCTGLTNVEIPDSVTSIGSSAFESCTGLTSVIIGDSVTTIGDRAFYGCTGLTSVTIGDSVTSIGSSAFYGCTGLTSVEIPDSVTSIDGWAFYECKSLESVTIGDSVTTIGQSTFYECTGLKSVEIPDKVTSIGYHAFYGCTGLTSVTIGDKVTSIGESAFKNCKRLTSVEIPDSVTSIGYEAFFGCTGLTSVTIGNGVTTIGGFAFYECRSLTSVTIGNGVTTIGGYAFYGCTGLTSVEIPDSVTTIGDCAFSGCKSLTTVNYKGTQEQWELISIGSDNGNLTNATINYNTITVTANDVSSKISGLGEASYTIIVTGAITSNTISAIKGALQSNSKAMVNLDLSGTRGLTSIGEGAFRDCNSLTSVTIPDSVTSIGSSAFAGCGSLTSVTIPNSVTTIGGSAFNGCTGLTSVTIPDGVTSIGEQAFYGCDNLTTVNYKGTEEQLNEITGINFGNVTINYYTITVTANDVSSKISGLGEASYTIIVTGAITNDTISAINTALQSNSKAMVNLDLSHIENLTGLPDIAFYSCRSLKSVTIGNSVTSIGTQAFERCTGLTSVTIPDSVTSIGSYAFYGCNSLTSVTIGDKVTSIGQSTFYECTGLKSVTIGNSVTSIGYGAFGWCSSLTSVTIPNSVTTIGNRAFGWCSSLTIVNYKGTEEQWGLISKGSENGYLISAPTINYGYTGE